jgi:hypothetical protein
MLAKQQINLGTVGIIIKLAKKGTLSQRDPINAGRARPTDIFVTYLRFSKRYVDENSTIRISVKIYTNS